MKKNILSVAVLAVTVSLGAPVFAEMKGMDSEKSQSESEERIESTGQINKVMPGKNKVVLTHDPIPALGWPKMKMGFDTSETVELEEYQKGDMVRFVIETRNGKNTIVEIEKTN